MLEAMSGIGLIVGPILGSIVFTLVGFELTFLFLGLALLPVSFMVNCAIRSKYKEVRAAELRKQLLEQEEMGQNGPDVETNASIARQDTNSEVKKASNCSLLANPRLLFACLCAAVAFFADTQLEPTFSMRLEDFNMTTLQIGFMFTVIPLTYMPSMLIV